METPKKRVYGPIERHYIELVMSRALQDRVSPYQYNKYGGTGIWLRMYRFEIFPVCAKFWVFDGTTIPVTWTPRTTKDRDFLQHMYYEYHTYRNQ